MSVWLSRQKKADLIEMAEKLGLESDGLRKPELEEEIETALEQNPSNDPQFALYYSRKRSSGSPIKKEKEGSVSTAMDPVEPMSKAVKRRVTRAAEDFVATDESEVERAATRATTALIQTPARASQRLARLAQDVPLPPSPAVVAEYVENQTAVVRSYISDKFEESGLVEFTEGTREAFSSVLAVQSIITIFELYKLRPEILPNRDAFVIPALGSWSATLLPYQTQLPDLFLLLTASFWTPALTWGITTFFVPLIASYFINLTAKPKGKHTHFTKAVDPLVFNIVKALLVFVVFGQDVTFGMIDLESVARINSAIYGGYKGALVGTAIGTLVTIYEASIKK